MKHDWQEWIDRLGNNDVSEQELRDFQQAVQESPEHIDEYMDALLVDASLGMKDGLLVSHVSNESEASKAQTLLTTTAPNLPAAKTVTT